MDLKKYEPLLEFSLRQMGFSEITELEYQDDWMPMSWYSQYKAILAIRQMRPRTIIAPLRGTSRSKANLAYRFPRPDVNFNCEPDPKSCYFCIGRARISLS